MTADTTIERLRAATEDDVILALKDSYVGPVLTKPDEQLEFSCGCSTFCLAKRKPDRPAPNSSHRTPVLGTFPAIAAAQSPGELNHDFGSSASVAVEHELARIEQDYPPAAAFDAQPQPVAGVIGDRVEALAHHRS